MKVKKSTVAAISAALQLYMQAEQQPAAAVEETGKAEVPHPALSMWAISGRQAAMEIRRFWQMRLIR